MSYHVYTVGTPSQSVTTPTATPTSRGTEPREGFPVVWVVVGTGVGLGVVIVTIIILLVCLRRSQTAKSTRQQQQGANGANHRGYPSNQRGTMGTVSSFVNNQMYDSAIHTTPNMAYCYSVATNHNVAYRATGDHSVPQSTTTDSADQIMYEDMDDITDAYDYAICND